MVRAEQLNRPGGQHGQGQTYPPSASIWPLVAVVAAALVLPGLIHGLPLAAQVGLIVPGALVGAVAIIGWIGDDLLAPARAARWQLITTPSDPPMPYTPPTAGPRGEADVALHLRALQDIAALRFNFPTAKYRDYRTYLNQPQRTMGIRMPGGSVAYPDLVVVQSPENHTRLVAQVETAETVNEDRAFYEWGPYAELAPLYLYVPVGCGEEALALCRKLDIPVVGVRTWRYIVGYQEIEVSDYYTA